MPTHAFAMFEMPTDFGRGNCRTVAGEDGGRRDQLFDRGEDFLFEWQLLGRGFENPVCTAHRGIKRIVR